MPAPSYVASGAGLALTTGTGATDTGAGNVGDLVILQALQDGTTASAVTLGTVPAAISNLAGTSAAMTAFPLNPYNVGSPTAALQFAWIGRINQTALANIQLATTGDDVFANAHRFRDVSLGTAIADVIENSTAGAASNGVGTSTTVSDTAVVTLGSNRLAVNLVGINDDATGIAAFAGASGGTWAMSNSFESATGTDGTVSLMTAPMPSAGTIDGGSDTITSDGWGVIGFALIGTPPAPPPPRETRDLYGLGLRMEKLRSGIFVPERWRERIVLPGAILGA